MTNSGGAETIAQTRDAEATELKDVASETPVVAAILEAFPGATIAPLKTAQELAAETEAEVLPEVDDEWDPFEDG